MKHFQNMLEDHTEKNFGIDIMGIPGRMESTLLRLLKKSKANKDPLNEKLNPKPTNYAGDIDVPDNMNGLNINYEIDLTVPDNMNGLHEEISGLEFPERIVISKDEIINNLDPPQNHISNPQLQDDTEGLALPTKEVQDHLEDLKATSLPNDIVLDTIIIELVDDKHVSKQSPKKFERIRISEHPQDPLDKQLREFPVPDDFEDLGGAPKEHQNPLLKLVDAKSDFNTNILSAPKYRQDPLLRQLQRHPERFQDDFLQLPRRKQDTLLKLLRKSGPSSFDIDRLVPPGYKQNPLLRLLQSSDEVS